MRNDRFLASRSEEGRARLLIEAISDYAIYMLDPNGIVTSWNPGAQRFKGYTPSEIIGQHFSRFYTDEDRAAELPQRALETAARTGKFEAEGWRVRKDGTQFWAYVVIDVVRTPDGEIVGYAKITRDLTERRNAEQVLKVSEEQFKLLVQGVTDYAIYMLSPTGTVNSWNSGAERIKGYKPDEIIGQHFSVFYTQQDRASNEPQKALDAARREGRFEKEGWRLRKDGTRFLASVIIDAIHDDDGEIIGFAKITRDVTALRENQEALDRAREELFHSHKMDAIGQLTGGVAHDFNNLLTAILGSLELLRKRLPDDPRSLALLDNAVQGAQRGATLTQRLLAFARRQEMKRESINLLELVRGMSDLLQRSLGSSIVIQTVFPLKLAAVSSDPHQIELAILNLVVNARDAMPDGGTITISAQEGLTKPEHAPWMQSGRYVCLSVADDGEGMDDETLQRATEPFFTTKGVGKGTGLGLSMAHGVAEQSGGTLTIESTKGAGTTIRLWLPVVDADTIPELPSEIVEPLERQRSSSLNVLVVDDDFLVMRNTALMLEDLGHQVIEAGSGSEALKVLAANADIELVLTDQNMPGMTGTQLAQQIRENWPHVKMILATGYADLPRGERTDIARLSKPFTQSALDDVVSKAAFQSHVSSGAGSSR
ncbi:MAG TPA: PAS domain S-box protein [Beijerinckiaceae bacterium]|nr:PAS domain S-box protein [Beijerinckiaceae bacterium]